MVTKSPTTTPQVLIVEDQAIVALTIENQLKNLGYRVVDTVAYGEEAVQRAETKRPDLVLMDIKLQGEMDGVEAAEQIRTRWDIPVIYVTAHADEETLRRAKISAPSGYILKPFKDRDLEVAIDVALHQHRMEAQLRQHNRQLALLNQAGQAFSSTLDLDQVLLTVLEETRQLFGVAACSIWLIDPETDDLVCQHATGSQGDTVRGWRLAQGEGLAGQVVESGESLIVQDAQKDARYARGVEKEMEQHLRAILTVPLQVKADVIGVLQVVDIRVATFSSDDLALLEPLAASAAIAIENARLFEQAQREIAERIRSEKERARAEEKLRESESKYRELIETMPYGVEEVNLEGRMTFVNEAYCRILGYQPEELMGRYIWEFDPTPAHVDRLKTYFEYIKNEQPTPEPYRSQNVRKDGEVIDVFVDWSYLRDENGTLRGFISVVTDITDRVRAEMEQERLLIQVQAQAQQLQHVMDAVPEGMLLLNRQHRVILANPVARRDLAILTDASLEDILTHLGDVPLEDLLTSPPEGLWHEVYVKAPLGGRTFEVIARPIESGPNPAGWVLVTHDVTQEREIQRRVQRQERLASVGQLAAGIAHDFNNVIAVISLYAKMLLRDPGLTDDAIHRLETIDEQAWRASDLIQQILDFSRSSVLERQPMDLLIFLKEQVKMFHRTLTENIEIHFSYDHPADVDADAAYIVNADPTRLQQVVMNLVVNARDAMPEGGELDVRLARLAMADPKEAPLPEMAATTPWVEEWIRLTVTDTGTGIPPDVLPHVFDPFFTTKTPEEGTGLGLAQVYGIVDQHEGAIDVVSETGQGTTFTIYLPAMPAQQPEVHLALQTEPPLGQGQTILVVEDSDRTREAIVASLEMLNYRVLQAANGLQALDVIEEAGPIALVLSDVVMPKMGGRALFQALKLKQRVDVGEVRMILMSGHPIEEELQALQAQGLDGWIAKPPDLAKLGQLIAQVIGAREEGR